MHRIAMPFVVLLFLAANTAGAALPAHVAYQGYIEEDGVPVTGARDLRFVLFLSSAGVDSVWAEAHGSVNIDRGVFSVDLGSTYPLTPAIFDHSSVYLETRVNGVSLSPRRSLDSVPYALLTERALQADHAELCDSIAGGVATYWAASGANIYNTNTGRVGIGTSTPGSKLHVLDSSAGSAFYGRNDGAGGTGVTGITTSGTGLGIYGTGPTYGAKFLQSTTGNNPNAYGAKSEAYGEEATGFIANASGLRSTALRVANTNTDGAIRSIGGSFTCASGTGTAVYGEASATESIGGSNYGGQFITRSVTGYGVYGENTSIYQDYPGVYGVHNVTPDYGVGVLGRGGFKGVEGLVTGTTGSYYGVNGSVTGTGDGRYGVRGAATGDGGFFAYGVYGTASGTASYNYGVYGLANGTAGTNYGVYGYATGTGSYAGYFYGNVHVNGTLSKSAGSFRIDHPLDPENKYLQHSFVESPDMMNVYNGNIILDADGTATITMPDYFEALNKEFRYQLTCIGGSAPVYIAEEMQGNRFRIGGGSPGLKVSWQVTGVRQDAYANAHRIKVEEDKPASERGTFLNAVERGQPIERQFGHEPPKEMTRTGK